MTDETNNTLGSALVDTAASTEAAATESPTIGSGLAGASDEAKTPSDAASTDGEIAAQNLEAAVSDVDTAADAERKAVENTGHSIIHEVIAEVEKITDELVAEIKSIV